MNEEQINRLLRSCVILRAGGWIFIGSSLIIAILGAVGMRYATDPTIHRVLIMGLILYAVGVVPPQLIEDTY